MREMEWRSRKFSQKGESIAIKEKLLEVMNNFEFILAKTFNKSLTMSYKRFVFQKRDNVLILNITGPVNEPEKVALLSHELSELSREIAWDDETSVVILTGGEKCFSMGIHFGEVLLNSDGGRIRNCCLWLTRLSN